MPHVKTKRDDILRPPEILDTVRKARDNGQDWLACAISIATIFGKRVNEIMSLTREQIVFDDKFLTIRFRVGKKREKDTPIPIFYLKRKTLQHPLVQYIKSHVDTINTGYIFPSSRKPTQVNIKRAVTLKDGNTTNLEYNYTTPGGYISPSLARYYLKKIAPSWWWHLCRESLATSMAEEGATEEELMHWFDWETPNSPHKYVKRGTRLTEKWSERGW